MPPRTLFTADHHFGHRNILSPTMAFRRPFASIEEHDEALIAHLNFAVRPEDTVWHLGDFCYRCPEAHARAVFGRLNGHRRILVRGNHDRVATRLLWDEVVDVARVVVPDPVTGAPVGPWVSHYAHRAWPRRHYGDLHLHGRSHGSLPGTATSTDVGVDCFDFRPVTLAEIRVRLAGNARVGEAQP